MASDHNAIATDDAQEAASVASETGRTVASRARSLARRAVGSGADAVLGGVCLLDSRRAFRRGDEERGLVSLLLGGLLVAVAITRRRSPDDGADRTVLERLPVVDASPVIDDVLVAEETTDDGADETTGVDDDAAAGAAESTAFEGEATGDDAEDVGEPSADADDAPEGVLEDAGSTVQPAAESGAEAGTGEPESGEDELEEPSLERIGEAAFDQHSGEIPVPQRAFNNDVLALNAEAFWGIREADDAVVVSQLFDPIQEREGVRYVASTQVDGDRMLRVPDVVLNHWDGVAGGGTAVVSGDGLVFAIDERLRSDDQLLVVPAAWADDLLGDGE